MHVRSSEQAGRAAGLPFQVAGELLGQGRGLIRGQVIGPRASMFPGASATALIAAPPVYLPDGFAVCEAPSVTIVVSWLVPITTGEARLVSERGWSALEDTFDAEEPDLTDPYRAEPRAGSASGDPFHDHGTKSGSFGR